MPRKTRPDGRRPTNAERDESVRAQLEPYAPGERPAAIVAAVIVAVALAAANVGLMVSGFKLHGHRGGAVDAGIGFAVVMAAVAAGMWQMRYWAVLGFQALLALAVLIAAMSMIIASNAAAFALCLTLILGGGTLFWKLVRVLSRLQAPARKSVV